MHGPPQIVGLQAEDLHAWEVLRPLLGGGYLPWSVGSIRPAGLVVVCNEVVHGRRRAVLELGAGVSTVVLARLLRARGGRLVALEHDPHWAQVVRELLAAEDLDDVAHVAYAPLQLWYDLGGAPAEADLLVVDGPPARSGGGERDREPALPALDDRLDDGAAVVLDDVVRPGEQAVLAAWEATTAWRFAVDDAAGVAVGRRR